jgi:hypothetical protein
MHTFVPSLLLHMIRRWQKFLILHEDEEERPKEITSALLSENASGYNDRE